MSALILTFHAIERGRAPLCIEPALFRAQLEVIEESSARVVSLVDLLEGLDEDRAEEPLVAITFDDGFASVIDNAVPVLAQKGMPATIFCVAGHLGGLNDWPTEPSRSPRRRLASAAALAEAAGEGVALGSHGMRHEPLDRADESALRREVLDSREALEDSTGVPVRWFAFPYGVVPRPEGGALLRRAYEAAFAGGNRHLGSAADRFGLPRVESHYLRRPSLLGHALEGGSGYLRLRRLGAGARRLVRKDHQSDR